MRIDIDKLTEAELIDLNNRVVARLQFLAQMRAHAQMLEFKIGNRVFFQADGHRRVVGRLTRYNRKTVTAIADESRLPAGSDARRTVAGATGPNRHAQEPRGDVPALTMRGYPGGGLQLALPAPAAG